MSCSSFFQLRTWEAGGVPQSDFMWRFIATMNCSRSFPT
jgi:hypothetical protein